MLEFVKKAFRGFIGIVLWVNLILCTIAGGIIGNALSGWGADYTFLGVIIGLALGLLTNIVGGGFVATILNIDKNLEEQKNLLRQQMGLPVVQPEAEPEEKKNVTSMLSSAISSAIKPSENSAETPAPSPPENPAGQGVKKKQCNRCKKIVDGSCTVCPYCSGKKSTE